jgi:hypothetical protein
MRVLRRLYLRIWSSLEISTFDKNTTTEFSRPHNFKMLPYLQPRPRSKKKCTQFSLSSCLRWEGIGQNSLKESLAFIYLPDCYIFVGIFRLEWIMRVSESRHFHLSIGNWVSVMIKCMALEPYS